MNGKIFNGKKSPKIYCVIPEQNIKQNAGSAIQFQFCPNTLDNHIKLWNKLNIKNIRKNNGIIFIEKL